MMKTKSLVKFAIFSILLGIGVINLSNLNISSLAISGNVVKESYKNIEVYFCPRENCSLKLEQLIRDSDKVDCALYDLDLENLKQELVKKQYRLVTDIDNDPGIAHRENKGSQLMHNKFCIFDDKIISTGSFNPTNNGNYKNNNNLIIIESEYLVQNYKEEFEELWNLEFGKGNPIEFKNILYGESEIKNLFCPDDSCAEEVIKELSNAKESIYFMLFSFTDDNIGDKLVEKNQLIDVKGILEKRGTGSQYSEYKRLKENNVTVRLDSNSYSFHHKVFIIDKETVITGSYNPTSSGNNKNDENVLIIKDKNIANQYLEEFNSMWSISNE